MLMLLPPPVVGPQLSGAFDVPLTVMGTVEPELVSVAVPVTVQLVSRGEPGQVPVAVSVAVVPAAVNVMLPGFVVVEPPQVSVKL
jgi:hypothetical protein